MFSERGLMMIAVEDFQIKVFLSVCQSVFILDSFLLNLGPFFLKGVFKKFIHRLLCWFTLLQQTKLSPVSN